MANIEGLTLKVTTDGMEEAIAGMERLAAAAERVNKALGDLAVRTGPVRIEMLGELICASVGAED